MWEYLYGLWDYLCGFWERGVWVMVSLALELVLVLETQGCRVDLELGEFSVLWPFIPLC